MVASRADVRGRAGRLPGLLILLLGVAALSTAPRPAAGQAGGEWVGRRVILQFGSVLRVGMQVVDNQKHEASPRVGRRVTDRIYRVEQVSGPWIWIKAETEGVSGWVRAAEVIPYDQAIDYFTNRIRANPRDDSVYISRGHIWRDRKEYDIALADYSEAIRLDPGSEVGWCSRGNAWSDKKEYDKALADYAEAIRLDPKDATAYYSRGNAWSDKKEYDKAPADYAEAIRLDPKLASAFFNRSVAQMLLRRGDAVGGFRKVLDLQGWKGDLSPYAVILGHLAARRAGDDAAARAFLEDSAGKLDASAWPEPAVRFLRGAIDEPALLATATDDDKRTEARCYLGLDHALKGHAAEALAHFRWVQEHGNRAFIEYTIALAELGRTGGPAADAGPATRAEPAAPEVARAGPPAAGAATFVGTTLYVPTPELEARFGSDPKPLADYVDRLKARTVAILAAAEPPGAAGLLVAVGLKAGRRSRAWCQAVEGEIPAALLRTLERELAEVEPIDLKASPAGFGLKFALHGSPPAAFPEVPDRWQDASRSTRTKRLIPPDDLFKILWPD